MQARVLALAKTPPQWLRQQCDGYAKMVLPPWKVTSHYLALSRFHGKDNARARREDCEKLLGACSHQGVRIALDARGRSLTSEALSRWLIEQWDQHRRGELQLLIGGPLGLDTPTLDKCHASLSLSRLTLPHALAHLLLLEQLYRANCIARGSGYHK